MDGLLMQPFLAQAFAPSKTCDGSVFTRSTTMVLCAKGSTAGTRSRTLGSACTAGLCGTTTRRSP